MPPPQSFPHIEVGSDGVTRYTYELNMSAFPPQVRPAGTAPTPPPPECDGTPTPVIHRVEAAETGRHGVQGVKVGKALYAQASCDLNYVEKLVKDGESKVVGFLYWQYGEGEDARTWCFPVGSAKGPIGAYFTFTGYLHTFGCPLHRRYLEDWYGCAHPSPAPASTKVADYIMDGGGDVCNWDDEKEYAEQKILQVDEKFVDCI